MKTISLLTLALSLAVTFSAKADEAADSAAKHIPAELQDFTYKFKVDNFDHRPKSSGAIVMLGDSLTDLGGWSEYFPDRKIVNRGISGDNTFGIMHRADQVIALRPSAIFLLAGTNDLFWGSSPEEVMKRYDELLNYLQAKLPLAKIVVQTVTPIVKKAGGDYGYLDNVKIEALNALLIGDARTRHLQVIDLHSLFVKDGQMNPDYTTDGIHLNGLAYDIWSAQVDRILQDIR